MFYWLCFYVTYLSYRPTPTVYFLSNLNFYLIIFNRSDLLFLVFRTSFLLVS